MGEGTSTATTAIAGEVANPKQQQQLLGESKWVQCDECQQWRSLPGCTPEEYQQVQSLDRWFCTMNVWDKEKACCEFPEEIEEEIQQQQHHASAGGVATMTEGVHARPTPLKKQAAGRAAGGSKGHHHGGGGRRGKAVGVPAVVVLPSIGGRDGGTEGRSNSIASKLSDTSSALSNSNPTNDDEPDINGTWVVCVTPLQMLH